jgi:hypothetical protein
LSTHFDGARRALGCISHELSSPLMALYTYVKLAGPDDPRMAAIRACVDRLRTITDLAREVAHADETGTGDVAAALAAGAIACEPTGDARVALPQAQVGTIVGAVVRAVRATLDDGAAVRAQVSGDGARVRLRVGPDGVAAPTAWQPIDPWAARGAGLAVWSAAVLAGEVGGEVRLGERDGAIVVEVELPAAVPA